MRLRLLEWLLPCWLSALAGACLASEELVTEAMTRSGEAVPYILNRADAPPKYLLILFPGGNGVVNARLENGQLAYEKKGNFLLRARQYWVDDEFATVTTNSTQVEERVQALIDHLQARYPTARIYLVGTSRGTFDTLSLAAYLSDKIAGEIHTSSLSRVASFDASKYKNRQLIVHHKLDACRVTPYAAAESAHDRYGTDFIAMDGGISVGDPCEAFAHHGYNGIERETVAAIKAWIKRGP